MNATPTLIIDGRAVVINGERNILDVARKAGIDIPTFCYHSQLSIYGACRLCLVDIEGRGVVASCSVKPEAGMKVRTHTQEIRQMRRIALELLLANHEQNCPTCPKSAACELQNLARRLGVDKVRFKPTHKPQPVDRSSPSLVRDPNKCILCGDCVRACSEIQSIGAIDFANRGAAACVVPAFGKDLAEVECVNCGFCAAVCPTGALTPKPEIEEVWDALDNPQKTVVAQIAPAVRVAIGEQFGLEAGAIETGRLVAALKALGFDHVYDTSFAADLTVIEEAHEFLGRKQAGERLPQFTSCCPGWVKFCEQFFPSLLPNLSTCRSPQQMFGALAKEVLPERLQAQAKEIVVVSIMPCTAKKYEAKLPKFRTDGRPDVDHVLTTQELARMIEEAGIRFEELEPQSLDMPLGFKTGAGVIFGATGGVTEAVLRFAAEKLRGVKLDSFEFPETRGAEGVRELSITVGKTELKLAIVHGLKNARALAEQVRDGTCQYDLIEVMACPGGCIGGAGQPVTRDPEAKVKRTKGLYNADKMLQLHKSQENHLVADCYEQHLGDVGGHAAHRLLHTGYQSRRRIADETISLSDTARDERLRVSVCIGTSCFVRGAEVLLRKLVEHIGRSGLQDRVHVEATFCFEQCNKGPTVRVGASVMNHATLEGVVGLLDAELAKTAAAV
ncbi:MAG: [FeFe] hydrogenase, group A [Planctomycetota bacterium]